MTPLAFPTGRDPRDLTTEHLSVSQANLIHRCPLQWRFRYIDALPQPEREQSDNLRLGVAIDAALSACYTGLDPYPHLDALPPELRAKGYTALDQWRATSLPDLDAAPGGVQRRHVHTIYPRGFYAEGLDVIGYSDLITTDGTLIDWKYGGTPNDAAWVQQVSRQLRFYAYAESELFISRALIVRFGGRGGAPTLIDVPLSVGGGADMVEWLYDAAEHGPGATHHAPTPGRHCGYCPYTEPCAAQLAVWAGRLGHD